jgi:plastocyanin
VFTPNVVNARVGDRLLFVWQSNGEQHSVYQAPNTMTCIPAVPLLFGNFSVVSAPFELDVVVSTGIMTARFWC